MNILVSISLSKKNIKAFNEFLELLRSFTKEITLFAPGQKNISIGEHVITENIEISPDIIIAFNKKGLINARKISKKYNAPVVYTFCNSDMEKEYNWKLNEWDKLIVIDDDNNVNKKFFPDKFTTFLNLPCRPLEISSNAVQKTKKIILVELDDSLMSTSLLYEIAPVVNSLFQLEFVFKGKNKRLSGYFNSNARAYKNNLTSNEVSLVIGNGRGIEQAIANLKPCIVVGRSGFGGLITNVNLNIQLANGFQGRIGGGIGEYIPEKVLMDEILDFFEMEQERVDEITKENHELLQNHYSQTKKQLHSTLNNNIKDYNTLNNDLFSTKLEFSNLFNMIQINDKQYMLQIAGTKLYHSTLDLEEHSIIHDFINGNYVKNVAKACGYEHETDSFLDFIRELFYEKILKLAEI